ncbi:MAG: DUF1800 family protein [Planctomycetes bacterium]|nr:DUF1800 family protein [Planctomycetota bacterium]
MARVPQFGRRWRRVIPVVAAVLSSIVASAVLAGAEAEPEAAVRHVEHLTEVTVAEAGRGRVIAFRVSAAPDEDLALPASVADPAVLVVTGEALVAAGENLGYVRVLAREVGETTLTIDDAVLRVRVIDPRHESFHDRFAPRISGPSDGAVVWGVVSVGVSVQLRPDGSLPTVLVRCSDGRTLEPVEDTGPAHQPARQLRFELDVDELPEGLHELTPVVLRADGEELAGAPVFVRAIRPAAGAVAEGEAEKRYDVERPERFRDGRMDVGRDRRASGGMYFNNAAALPAVCFPVKVDEPGWYQLTIVARGTRAQGVLPTIGVVVDGAPAAVTNGRLLGEEWHRMTVGVPFSLEPGAHVVTPYFVNDYFVRRRADRNLHVDYLEVARVDSGIGDLAEADPGFDGFDGFGMDSDAGAAGGMAGAMAGGEMNAMNAMDASDGGVAIEVDDPFGVTAAPLRVAFRRPLEDAVLPGLMEVAGRCWWIDADTAPAPIVTLLVNDRAVTSQRSGAPRFWIDPSNFEPGANRVQLIAHADNGTVARTPGQTMHWPEPAALQDRPEAREHYRYSIHEEAWDREILVRLRNQHYPKERRAAVFTSNGDLGLTLPDALEGSFLVFLELRGDHFQGAPVATVRIEAEAATLDVGQVKAPTGWNMRHVGAVELSAGPKRLLVGFHNDRHVQGVGDRNLWLQSVILAHKPKEVDEGLPVVEVLHPRAGCETWMQDVLVAEASDNASLRSAELILDGELTGFIADLNLKSGRLVLPLLLRDLEPGPHTVAVRVTDITGNSVTTEPRDFVVLATPPKEPSNYERAVRMLNRFAYGPDPDELAAAMLMGERAWLADRLSRDASEPGDIAALGATFTHFPGRNEGEVPNRAIAHLLLTPNPARARFVLWAENHFSTWVRKTGGPRKWDEHVAFTKLGAAPFDYLLTASSRSPAMLAYLDQIQSVAGNMNENYAREIMELHTLGVDGGYSQEDVTSLARLLTGWSAVLEGDGRGGGPSAQAWSFRFDPNLNTDDDVSVIGMHFDTVAGPGRFDRIERALEALAAHPSTARFVSRKLAEHYAGVPAPEALVNDLADLFLATNGDLRAMVLAMAEHPALWSGDASVRVAHPIDYAVRAGRATRHFQPWQISQFLQRSGRGLFNRPTPDGYPEEDATVTDSNALAQRWRLAQEFRWPLINLVPNAWRNESPTSEREWSQRIVDVIAVRLTGIVLSETSNDAAITLLAESGGPRHERVRMIAPFIAQLPEANLR